VFGIRNRKSPGAGSHHAACGQIAGADEPGTSGEMRYRMLETLRDYAVEKLLERREAPEWRARHAAWFLALAEQAAPELRRPDQLRWLARLQLEYDNLRAALHWCLDGDGTIETGVKFAGALAGFWRIRGHVSEGQAWRERAPARADEAPPSAHATLLNGSGELAQFPDRFGLARGLHKETLAIRRALGDHHGTAESLRNLGRALLGKSALDGAKMCFDESLTLARDANDRWAMAASLTGLGNLAHARGELDDALSSFQRAWTLRASGVMPGKSHMFFTISGTWRARGRAARCGVAQRRPEVVARGG
jgi:tetratricopeptide (TPR) repeat protein